MEPRERVQAALSHRQPDSIPIDLGGPANSLSKYVAETLVKQLHLPIQKIPIWQIIQGQIELPEPLLQHLNVDTRHIHGTPPEKPPTLTGKTETFVDWLGLHYQRKGPFFVVTEPPLASARSIKDIDAYPWPKPKASWFKKAAAQARTHYKNGFAVVADPSAPGVFELGCWLMGWTQFLTALLRRPQFAVYLLDRSLELHRQFWQCFLEAVGDYTQIVVLGDDYGINTGPFMDPELFKQLVQPRLSQLVTHIKAVAPVAVMLHSCGAIHSLIPSLIDADIDVLSPIQPLVYEMRAAQLKDKFGEDLTLHGGIDLYRPETTSLESLHRELKTLATSGGYIFGLTNSVLDPSQLDHFLRVFTSVRELKM